LLFDSQAKTASLITDPGNRMSARIRVATTLDREVIRGVHLRTFSDVENQLVATLAVNLLDGESVPETISLVAETVDGVVGHIAFSPVMADADRNWLGYILAPLSVKPEYQKLGIGSKLIKNGMELLSRKTADVLFVYGDPKYYGRFGFSAEAAARFLPPYPLRYPFGWQARVLRKGGPGDQTMKLTCVPSLRDPALW